MRNCPLSRAGIATHALIEHVNARAEKRSIFALFRAHVLFFQFLPLLPLSPGVSVPYRRTSRVCKPVSCHAHSLTTNFVNGFHSGGFSRSSHVSPNSSSLFLSFFLRLFAALIARLSNCHFLRQIVLKSSGSHRHAHQTRRRKEEESKKGSGKGRGGEGKLKGAVRDNPGALGGCL